jgi:hypothetical protein
MLFHRAKENSMIRAMQYLPISNTLVILNE